MITLGCPTYRANAARLRLANRSLLPFFSRENATICLYTVDVYQNCDHVRIFLSLQKAVVPSDDLCAGLDLLS